MTGFWIFLGLVYVGTCVEFGFAKLARAIDRNTGRAA